MQRLSGNGTAFVEIDGHAVEYDLSAGQEILISTGYLAAMEEKKDEQEAESTMSEKVQLIAFSKQLNIQH